MAFLDGNDEVGDMSVTVFPNLFTQVQSWLHKDMVVVITGKVEKTNAIQVVANTLEPADNAQQRLKKQGASGKWYLRIDDQHDKNQAFHKLSALTSDQRGNVPVVVHETASKKTWQLANQFNLASGGIIKDKLITIFGQNNVIYK
nr:OB-fold nucleic acid binding domain-containing protein [Lentilactobacillus parafarraginis]